MFSAGTAQVSTSEAVPTASRLKAGLGPGGLIQDASIFRRQGAVPPSIYRPSRYAGALLFPSGEIDLEVPS
jgi:hypothetical protein